MGNFKPLFTKRLELNAKFLNNFTTMPRTSEDCCVVRR